MIRENLLRAEPEIPRGIDHALRLLITNRDDLRIRMLRRLPQQIAHVKVVKVDPGDAPFFAHKSVRGFLQLSPFRTFTRPPFTHAPFKP